MTDIDNTYSLIAGVYRQAIKDARRGDSEAIHFLDVTAPDWRDLSRMYRRNCQSTSKKYKDIFFSLKS